MYRNPVRPPTPWHVKARRGIASNPSAVLLVVQLLSVIAYPFTGESGAGRLAIAVLGLLTLVLALRAVRRTPLLTWVGGLVGVPAVALSVGEVLLPEVTGIELASMCFHAVFYFYVVFALLVYMFSDNWVTSDELWATGATFTVAAWAFAYTYGAVQLIWPGSFAAPHGEKLSWFELIFLSFTTMTGTGLSDITPAGNHARSFIILEEMAGMNYVALVVARLMGLTLTKFRR
ncbi:MULTISPECIES: ion channel [Kytococcus]|uniref:Two pore domain potassium channel family protein n=1 Tax=Kytococcus schroeteri TaxID=138300 RepID=A0A2I1PD77_9MICO|nr:MULTISPECIES: ion channel [Kytococcus]OFS13818.1 Ion channel [Kytococcus sp. HMSC28H12]PKZ42531.1 two pore domain potassium channel family protein [Kytococcus schroeteri]